MLVALDPAVGVSPESFAADWEADEQTRRLGAVRLEAPRGQEFVPGLLELVVIPIAVSVASGVLTDLIRRLVGARRPSPGDRELEVVETTSRGDRVVVVRLRGEAP